MSNNSESILEKPGTQNSFTLEGAFSFLRNLYHWQGFWPTALITAGMGLCYWPLFKHLLDLWARPEGYYSHGYLVPILTGIIIYNQREKLAKIPIKPGWLATLPLLVSLLILRAGVIAEIYLVMSVSFILCALSIIWFTLGLRRMLTLSSGILYLLFALPVWTSAIDVYTNPLQRITTKIAFFLLKILNFQPMIGDPTTIYLNNFTLGIGVPCSGLKLILSVVAFTIFFVLVSNLRLIGNVALLVMAIPLSLFINGLRITLIGIVGNLYGQEAGARFHDYSGYIVLVLCFFILFKVAGWLECQKSN